MSEEYKQALKAAQVAGKEWQAAKLAYRSGFITNAQFALASELFKASNEAFDAAYAKESA